MASAISTTTSNEQLTERATPGLDVDWLLHRKDGQNGLKRTKSASESSTKSNGKKTNGEPTPSQQVSQPSVSDPHESIDPLHKPQEQPPPQSNGTASKPIPTINEPKAVSQQPHTPPQTKPSTPQRTPLSDENKGSKPSGKKDGRRSSWFSSLGSKFSSNPEKSPRTSSVSSVSSNRKSPQASPGLIEKSNPFENASIPKDEIPPEEKPVHTGPRRPSVLVAAGTETKLDHQPGFLGALRRLSSGNTATMGKAAGVNGAVCPRKIMNVDHNRQRTKIPDFDQNKLRRVAFKVDVEIAGIAAQSDEQQAQDGSSQQSKDASSKDSKMAKYKDRSEGAALKKSTSQEESAPPQPDASTERQVETKQEEKKDAVAQQVKEDEKKAEDAAETTTAQPDQPPMTRKKEKKKRSEAERKERKEKKRRQAEANGLIPLELTLDDDSDSSNPTPSGAATPKKGQPTTDPLRIYKRCCQLRETTALAAIKDQISNPSATLAEAPGTVPSIDLTGTEFTLQDIQTFGDWLAVVPVRRLVLDDCNLTDEGIRIILSGLSGCKTQEQARANRKLPKNGNGKPGVEQMGVVEKISLKNNSSISALGWKHIALFINLCPSLRAIDLSGIPFPAHGSLSLSRTSTTSTSLGSSQELPPKPSDWSQLFARALSERYGDRLEELILSGCALTSHAVSEIIDSVIKCRIKRLGLAHNNLDSEAVNHIVRYVTSGMCEGLDMGGNDMHGCGHLITEVLDESNPLFAMSLADCNLSIGDLRSVLSQLSLLKNFKFIDLSRNQAMFESGDVVSLLRRRLPLMKGLKRIHLSDVNMSPTQLISLAEIFPDCKALAHVSILDNQKLVDCMNSNEGEAQEEACAVFVSLMTAVRASQSLVAVEIEVPSQESSEVIKALASQVVAYSLRNLERTSLSDYTGQTNGQSEESGDKQAPDVLLHLVGHMDGYSQNADNDEPAPDEDYVIASTGIVKALGVCLGNRENSRLPSQNISPSASGTVTPRSGLLKPQGAKRPKDVTLELCESARKIRRRLRPAMVREDQAGNLDAYRKLWYLDQTLERTIKRFEDEYPESRPKQSPSMLTLDSRNSSYADPPDGPLSRLTSLEEAEGTSPPKEDDPYSLKLSRTSSNTSLAARALTQEEGRMHRFGQQFRREVLKPTGTDDLLHGTSVNDPPEAEHLATLRTKLEGMTGKEIWSQVSEHGADHVVEQLGLNAQELMVLKHDDPEAFEKLKSSQLAAQINAGILDASVLQQPSQSAHAATTT